MEHLYERLEQYARGQDYPYHMPGHKRRAYGELPEDLFRMDVTEIDGFDNLHAPEGIIKELQDRIAGLYGAQESFCLVGGSTAGILSAISAAVPMGGRLLMARNCHKSAYHAAYLRRLQVTYVRPPVLEPFGLCDGIDPGQVRAALEADPEIQAVLVTSPTYEGRLTNVRELAEIVHSFGKILIVDEAHGAHLGRHGMPENSCQAGADLVIHSIHKTLPALTQTALLHVSGDRVDRDLLRRFLRIYQSSSPSYVLMASIDNAVAMLERDGARLYGEFIRQFREMTEALSACKKFKFLSTRFGDEMPMDSDKAAFQDVQSVQMAQNVHDVGKLVIHVGDSGMTGQQLYNLLREKYHLQLEMAAGDYCLAMFTVGDAPEGYQRMRDALLEMDGQRCKEEVAAPAIGKAAPAEGSLPAEKEKIATENTMPLVQMSLAQAWDAPWEEVALERCEGRTSADFVNLYPPGTPILVPGEAFSKELCRELSAYWQQGLNLQGVFERGGALFVKCLKSW